MKHLLILLFALLFTPVSAQSLKTTFIEKIELKRLYSVVHTFAFGDSVTIYAYKKKSDRYHFLIETPDYADIISCNNIPFDVAEKQLKKLPNALSDEARALKKKLQQAVEDRKKAAYKKKALAGELWATVSAPYSLSLVSGTDYKLKQDDVVYIIGHSSDSSGDKYALYSTTFAGIYRTTSSYHLFSKDIDKKYMPSIDDADVQQLLADKQREIIQRQAEAKVRYRARALKGDIKGILSYSVPDAVDDNSSAYKSGDTVTVIGYSKVGNMNYYTLYSDYNYGVFRSSSMHSSTFRNSQEIDFDKLPAYDDPEVKLVLQNQSAIIDSVMQVRLEESKQRLAETTARLVQMYKDNQPFIITDIDWDSDSAGGIELSISITNCTQQTIKYVTFNGYFKNAVGDRCRNEIGGGTVWTGKGVGPIGPCPSTVDNCIERLDDCKGSYNFDNHRFYSRIANTFKLSSVTVQYMNGKTVTLSGAALDKHVKY